MEVSNATWAAVGTAVLGLLWLVRLNSLMKVVPPSIAKYSPHRWTKQEVRDTYDRLVKKPLDFKPHLPPKQNRRYVVVGGCGLVGGDIVQQLLQRGESPECIRILDFAPLTRPDMLASAAAKADVVKADITVPASVNAAFAKPWPKSVASLPLTVFHTAASMRATDRFSFMYRHVVPINVNGTANVMAAARAAGADIFVATASGSIGITPVGFWVWPWRSQPVDYDQFFDESDFDRPLRHPSRFFSTYARSKAEAERLVCGANTEGFRTGTIRPVNGVYGNSADQVFGPTLRMRKIASWTPHVVQNFVAGRNVALGHLLMEGALARPAMPKCAGRPFNITDDGAAPAFTDEYTTLIDTVDMDITIAFPPPLLLFCIAHVLEAWCSLLELVPFLKTLGLAEPPWPTSYLQPAIFTVTANTIGSDAAARKSVEEGGLGYRPGCTSLEGFCDMIRQVNQDLRDKKIPGGNKVNGKST